MPNPSPFHSPLASKSLTLLIFLRAKSLTLGHEMLNITIAEEAADQENIFRHAGCYAGGRHSSVTKVDLARAIYDRRGGLTNQEALESGRYSPGHTKDPSHQRRECLHRGIRHFRDCRAEAKTRAKPIDRRGDSVTQPPHTCIQALPLDSRGLIRPALIS